MSFMRPEAMQALRRWRAVLLSLAVMALGLWWAIGPGGLLTWLGWGLIAGGAVWLLASLQRLRFRAGNGGPGVVRVDEGAIAYFGPLTGGVVALSEIEALALDPTGRPAHWVLSQPGQPDLAIPLNAEGAEALFDAFASLPGIRTERMLATMRQAPGDRTLIWRRRGTVTPLQRRLH